MKQCLNLKENLCPICEENGVSPDKSHFIPQWATRLHLPEKEDNLSELDTSREKIIHRPKYKRGVF